MARVAGQVSGGGAGAATLTAKKGEKMNPFTSSGASLQGRRGRDCHRTRFDNDVRSRHGSGVRRWVGFRSPPPIWQFQHAVLWRLLLVVMALPHAESRC